MVILCAGTNDWLNDKEVLENEVMSDAIYEKLRLRIENKLLQGLEGLVVPEGTTLVFATSPFAGPGQFGNRLGGIHPLGPQDNDQGTLSGSGGHPTACT